MRFPFISIAVLPALAAALCFACAAPASGQLGEGRIREGGFELFLNQDFGDDAKPALVVSIAIPYRRLVFLLRDGRYEARFRVYLELMNASGERERGEVWEESIATSNYRETTSGAALARSSRRFPVGPGKYRAMATIEVLDTSRRFTREETVSIVGEGSGSIELSKPSFYSVRVDSGAPAPLPAAILVKRCPAGIAADTAALQGSVFGRLDAFARIRYGLVVPGGEAWSRIVFSTRIRSASGTVVGYHRAALDDLPAGAGEICIDINVDEWPIGAYTIETVAEAPGQGQRRETEGRFLVLFNRSLFGSHIDDLKDMLMLVADEKDVREITGAPPGERLRAWNAFWDKRDPSPSTASNEAYGEFLSRLQHVLEYFSQQRPGFRTDRGKTYLSLGPPDRIESRTDVGMRAYELWYYYGKGVVYIFEDAIGSGDYRLLMTRLL